MIPREKSTPDSHMAKDIVTAVLPEDARIWVPQAENVWFRPLMFNTVQGGWCNLLRVTRSGKLSRHRHPGPVHGYVIRGSWRYLEHSWVARAGMYVFEPPGEIHTLVVDADVEEMVTFFNISGAMIYLDAEGRVTAYEDVQTKIEMCQRHYVQVGLGESYIEQFIR